MIKANNTYGNIKIFIIKDHVHNCIFPRKLDILNDPCISRLKNQLSYGIIKLIQLYPWSFKSIQQNNKSPSLILVSFHWAYKALPKLTIPNNTIALDLASCLSRVHRGYGRFFSWNSIKDTICILKCSSE